MSSLPRWVRPQKRYGSAAGPIPPAKLYGLRRSRPDLPERRFVAGIVRVDGDLLGRLHVSSPCQERRPERAPCAVAGELF
jgi:hypothetical protein